MVPRVPQIVAFGGGGFSMESGNPLLDDYVTGLAAAAGGTDRPKVCFVPTASGDADHYIVRFYRAFSAGTCEPSHVSLFRRDRGSGIDGDIASHLLQQDLIYVGGGSVLSLLGTWKAHGLDSVLAECWRRGVVLCGLSAGSLCWFGEAVTAFHGAPERVEGLGLLPYGNCVHTNDPKRREEFRALVAAGEMGVSYGADDGAALHFVGRDLGRVVASRRDTSAFRLEGIGGEAVETPIPVQYLGEQLRLAAA